MGFIAYYLSLPANQKKKWSFFRKSIVYPTIIEKRIIEDYNKNLENSKIKKNN